VAGVAAGVRARACAGQHEVPLARPGRSAERPLCFTSEKRPLSTPNTRTAKRKCTTGLSVATNRRRVPIQNILASVSVFRGQSHGRVGALSQNEDVRIAR